jgi:hypothetical protein
LRKSEVRGWLQRRDDEALLSWAGSVRNPQRILMSLTFDGDELIRWRAIEALGRVAAFQAQQSIERVRDHIRRLLWLMNDESGGLGWHAPEIIGEILVNVPELIPAYGSLLPSYLREEPFERGTHFAVQRVAHLDPTPFRDSVPELTRSLEDPDPATRAYAALALHAILGAAAEQVTRRAATDRTSFSSYDFETGQLRDQTVGDAAKRAT